MSGIGQSLIQMQSSSGKRARAAILNESLWQDGSFANLCFVGLFPAKPAPASAGMPGLQAIPARRVLLSVALQGPITGKTADTIRRSCFNKG
jgi:hypothetical protein